MTTTIGEITRRVHSRMQSNALRCPHCASGLRSRSTRPVTPLVRQLYMQCVNEDCGATFGADLTITHMISPGAKPNPAVQMRTTPPRQRAAANDDLPGGSEVPPAEATDRIVAIA